MFLERVGEFDGLNLDMTAVIISNLAVAANGCYWLLFNLNLAVFFLLFDLLNILCYELRWKKKVIGKLRKRVLIH